jgi:hypothetical protein
MVEIAPTRADRNDALARTLRLPLTDIIATTEEELQVSVVSVLSAPEQLSCPGSPPTTGRACRSSLALRWRPGFSGARHPQVSHVREGARGGRVTVGP